MELLKGALPHVRRVALLWNPDNRNAQIEADSAMAVARQIGLTLVPLSLQSSQDLEPALARLATEKLDALYAVFSIGPVVDNRTRIVEFGLHQRAPVVSGWDLMTDAGGLLSYSPNFQWIFNRGAYYVARILRNAKPSELPVERPMTFELVVNLKTAKALGLTMPPEIMVQATRVIQ